MVNFADIAKKKIGEIERPPLPPVGTYRWRVTKLPTVVPTQDGKWEILTIPVQAVEAVTADMEDYKGEITGIFNQVKFMFNTEDEAEFEKSLFRARTFFEKHLGCCDESNSLAEALNASVNAECYGDIVWNQDKNDPEIFHANLTRTAPLD